MTYNLVRAQPVPPPVSACVLTIDSRWHLIIIRDGIAALADLADGPHRSLAKRSFLATLDAAIREWEEAP
jgi:hypothetical protein